jgi:hypothetical protein
MVDLSGLKCPLRLSPALGRLVTQESMEGRAGRGGAASCCRRPRRFAPAVGDFAGDCSIDRAISGVRRRLAKPSPNVNEGQELDMIKR